MIRSSQYYFSPQTLSIKKEKDINFFWSGFIIFSLSSSFAFAFGSFFKICQVFQITGLILMIPSAITLIRFKIENSYLRIVYSLYCLWLFILIIRGFNFLMNYSNFKSFLLNAGLTYFVPLVLLFPKDTSFYKKMFDFIFIFGIFYLVYDAFFIRDLLNSDKSSLASLSSVEILSSISFSTGFILLTIAYHVKKRQIIAVGIILLSFFFAIFRARRGLILMFGEMIFFSYLLIIFTFKKKILIIYLTVLVIIGGIYYASTIYKPQKNKIFGFVLERGDEDTRTGVELYFYDDMKTKDWIFGRGINGKYFCPNIEPDQVTNYRTVIETGYLETILKGGLISLGLYLLIAVPAILKGFFQSRNILSKAAGIWILLAITDSYPYITADFTMRYLIVWFAIGICYSKKIRNIPESQLKNYFLSSTY